MSHCLVSLSPILIQEVGGAVGYFSHNISAVQGVLGGLEDLKQTSGRFTCIRETGKPLEILGVLANKNVHDLVA